MKEKIVKSYIFLGNLPIYSNDSNSSSELGINHPSGCEFIINTRLKYELGVCSLQFINQTQPSVFNIDTSNFNSEVELDISSLIRIDIFLKNAINDNSITKKDKSFIQIFSTKSQKMLSYQKGAFLNMMGNKLTIIMDNKGQETFKINGMYQIEAFHLLIKTALTHLPDAYVNYDINKNHNIDNQSMQSMQSMRLNNTHIPKVVNKALFNHMSVASGNNVPPPVQEEHKNNIMSAPLPVTKQVIPQAPKF